MENLTNQIKKIIESKNYESLDSIAHSLNINIGRKTLDEKIEYINNINLKNNDKLIFYFKMSESRVLNSSIILEVFSYLINNFINKNKSEFLELLNNEKIINMFIPWFKKNINYKKINQDVLENILEIPKIQNEILFDMSFWNYRRPYELFNALPKDLGYLIGFFYEYDIKLYNKNLEELYNKYFSNILQQKDRLILQKEEIKLNRKTDIFHMNNNDKMLHFLYCLKEIKNNKNYYVILNNIAYKSGLNIDEVMKFAYKYDKTTFFNKLYNNEVNYTNNLIDKIKYLSKENKLDNDLIDIENETLENLQKAPKKVVVAKINLLGGPHSTYSNKMFKDGYKSEVRRIDLDGSVKICDATAYDHDSAIKDLYSDINFKETYSSAYEKSLEALKKISSITLIIENNTCLILLSNKISEEQKNVLNAIININNSINYENNLYGITVYNEDNNTNSFAYDGNTVTLEDAINYINSLEIKTKAVTR